MFELDIPGFNVLKIQNLVFDYNGTLACDGILISGVVSRLKRLAEDFQIHILTADTFGTVSQQLSGMAVQLSVLPATNQAREKLKYVLQLGADQTVTVGNGRNDCLMLKKAAVGILVLQTEGVALETLLNADIITPDINAALDLLLNPLRIKATLRS